MKIFVFIILIYNAASVEDFTLNASAKVVGAPQLKLILNDEYLITHTLSKVNVDEKYPKELKDFFNRANKIDSSVIKQFREYKNISPETAQSQIFYKNYESFFINLKKTSEFKKVRHQTIEYMNDSIKEWDTNLERSYKFVKKYSGFNFDYKVDVYITHPAVGNGQSHNSFKKILSFGALPIFKNYFTVYMWHEILHFHMGYGETNHAVNQLLTDNDLRVMMNQEKLFPLQGHPNLFQQMEKIMPKWKLYKQSPTDLNKFVNSLKLLK